MQHYFAASPLYGEVHFRRRFRVSRPIFEKIYNACLRHPYFQYNANAAGRLGIHPLVKTTAIFRHIAYGTCADQLVRTPSRTKIRQSWLLPTGRTFPDVRNSSSGVPKMFLRCASSLSNISTRTNIDCCISGNLGCVQGAIFAPSHQRNRHSSVSKAWEVGLAWSTGLIGLFSLGLGQMPQVSAGSIQKGLQGAADNCVWSCMWLRS